MIIVDKQKKTVQDVLHVFKYALRNAYHIHWTKNILCYLDVNIEKCINCNLCREICL